MRITLKKYCISKIKDLLDVKPGNRSTINLHKIAAELGISYSHLNGARQNLTYKDTQ